MRPIDILLTLLILDVLVIVHEFGHYTMARLFGVRVLEFSIGFGPVLGKIIRRGIQYSIRVIPLGGFVKMAGMDMAMEGDPAPEAADELTSLRHQPIWKKILIILAGPVNNLILAGLVFSLTLALVGVPSAADPRPIIGSIEAKGPAYEAGLSQGDLILSINGRPIKLWDELASAIRSSEGKPITILVQRKDRTFTRTITPIYDPYAKRYLFGFQARLTHYERQGALASLGNGFKEVYYDSATLVNFIGQALRGKARLEFMGPVGLTQQVGQSVQAGPWWILTLVGLLNLFLALFNLLPIPLPLLDGGWVVIYLIEGLRRREFSDEQKAAAQFFGLIMMLAFFLFVTYGDVLTGIKHFLNR